MARVDVRATAASGVWRSPQPLPLAHLAVTVNASDSGDVLIFWTQPINVAPPPAGVAADGSLGIGQAATFDTGLTNHGTVYVCDALGRAADVTLAGSDDPITAAQSAPNIVPPPGMTAFATTEVIAGSIFASKPIPIPAGTYAVLIAFPDTAAANSDIVVTGVQSHTPYYSGAMVHGALISLNWMGASAIVPVSAVIDREIIVSLNTLNKAGIVVPLRTPYVPQPLTVNIPQPLAVTLPNPPDPYILGNSAWANVAGAPIITIPTGRIWKGSVGIALVTASNPARAYVAGASMYYAVADSPGSVVTPDCYVTGPQTLNGISNAGGVGSDVWAIGVLL